MELPKVISTYLVAKNDRDPVTMLRCFAPGAVVHDAGTDIVGIENIRIWIATANKDDGLTVMPKYVIRQGTDITVTADVFGDFPGSPSAFDYHFTLERQKIASLSVNRAKDADALSN